ncbi:MAG: hypothetical protein R3F30_16200 [Planctomycetota bacterium]
MKHVLASLVALCLTVPLPAQQGDVPDGLAKWKQQHGKGWTVWNGPDGVPHRVFGPGADVLPGGVASLADARVAVSRLLEDHGAWLGTGPDAVVEHHSGETSSHVYLQYLQTIGGVPVKDALLSFVFHKGDGRLACMGSAARRLQVDTKPVLSKNEVFGVFRRTTGWNERLGTLLQVPVLEIAPDAEGGYRLCYKVSADFSGRPEGWTLWIDARTGAEVLRESTVHYCALCNPVQGGGALAGNIKGMISPTPGGLDPVRNPEKALPMAGVQVVASGVGSTYTDSNGDFSIPYTGTAKVNATISLASGRWWSALSDASSTPIQVLNVQLDPTVANNLMFNPTPTEYLTAQANGVKYMMDTHDWIKGVVPAMSAIDRNVSIQVNINSSCNAYFSGSSINFYRKAGSCNNTAAGSVIAHEYGHGVDSFNGGIGRNPATPSEGVADVIGAYFQDDPVLGRDFQTNGGYVRTGLNTLTWPLTGTSQEVHLTGQPYFGWAWDLLLELRSVYGPVVGKKVADKIVLESVLANPTDFYDYLLQVYLADDDDSNLNNGTPNIASLWRAANKRHFLRDVFAAIKVQHTKLADAADGSAGFTVAANVDNQAGKLTRADLYFDPGTGTFQKLAMTQGTGNQWSAKTPAVASGKVARYWFDFGNDANADVRYPAENGSYLNVAVGAKATVLAEGFESGNGPFTVQNQTSTNGWLRRTPRGRNFDPIAAAHGTWSFGTDRSGTDERAYNRAQTVSLTGNGVSTLGRKGMRLRFMRWLTSMSYTTARVYVNSTKVMEINQSDEQAWTEVDLDVSAAADNQASVVVKFEFQNTNTSSTERSLGGFEVDDVELYSLVPGQPGAFATYGAGCAGTAGTPTLAASGVPMIGKTWTVTLASAPASVWTVSYTGVSDKNWGPINLPLDLTGFGAKGCAILASGDLALAVQADGSGAASLQLPLPNDSALIGAVLFQQFLVLDAKANGLGITTSNGGKATIGG